MNATKLYCFVDETGQDTKGEMFLVAVVIGENLSMLELEFDLEEIERSSGKQKLKWSKTSLSVKQKYLDELTAMKRLKSSIYFSTYCGTKEYAKLTSLTIAKAVLTRSTGDYEVSIVIDGLNDKEKEMVVRELKTLKIRYRKVRGMRDEQNVFLRLADAMAGFLRDAREKEKYTIKYLRLLKERSIVKEI